MAPAASAPPIIGPSSDGGLLVQNVQNDQAVQVNLTDLPSSKVNFEVPLTQMGVRRGQRPGPRMSPPTQKPR